MSTDYNKTIHQLLNLPEDIQLSVGALSTEIGFVLLRISCSDNKYLPATLLIKPTLSNTLKPTRLNLYPKNIEDKLLGLLSVNDTTMDYSRLLALNLPVFECERDFNKIRRVIKAHA